MSAEDELGLRIERNLAEDPDAFEFARFWDDSETSEANFRIISWWLSQDSRCSTDEL
jgi:hypothetical protein